ncbi:MAG: hypothetical protein ACJ79L_18740 [Anaeromyxobacteraceae bacterium]
MRRLAALTTLALAAGCGLQNHRVAVGTVVRSPEAGGAGATTAQVFFGDRPDGAGAPTGIAGADVTLSWTGGAASSVGLDPVGPAGWYQVTGTDIPYVPGTTYTVTVASRGELFTISSVAPARPAIQELVPGTPAFPPASAVTFEKQTVSRAGDDVAFYAVAPLSGAPTCTNAPVGAGSQDAARLVELLLAPAAWQVPSFELWRTDLAPTSAQRCFPAPAAGQYVVTLTALAKGGASSNLFTGSGLLVGASDAGVLLVQ